LTTRYAIQDLSEFDRTTVSLELAPLPPEAGARLLRTYGIHGRAADLEQASREFGGDCLALTLLATYLRDRWGGDVTFRDHVDLPDQDRRSRRHARKVIAAYEEWFRERPAMSAVLRLLGLFDRPAAPKAVEALLRPPAVPHLTTHLRQLSRRERED